MSYRRYRQSNLALELGMIGLTILYFLPIYTLLAVALKPRGGAWGNFWEFPRGVTLANFAEVWREAPFLSSLLVSLGVTGSSILLLVALGAPAAYFLARNTDRLSHMLYYLFLLGIMFPFQLALVPLYRIMLEAGLLGNPVSVVAFHVAYQMPFTVFLYAGFIRSLSASYEEAALLDGATRWQAFWRVVVPLLRPITGTAVVLNVIFIWNDFLTPFLYLSGSEYQTLPVMIFAFVGEYTAKYNLIFAGLLMAMLPVLVLYFLLQRYVIHGFASGLRG